MERIKQLERQLKLKLNDCKLSKKNLDAPAILSDIPFERIYHAARKEASRKKPVFFIHKYFARRITCNFRMMLLGALLPQDADIWDCFYESFPNENLEDVTVLDPFMGGGTTVFESLRLNTKVIGSDLQPLSRFVTKALVEELDKSKLKNAVKKLDDTIGKEIMKYYKTTCPECGDTADIMYTFHVKKVKAHDSCDEHKLFSSFVLALKKNIFTLVCPECGNVFKHDFKSDGPAICRCGYIIESPKKSFVNHGIFECEKTGEKFKLNECSNDDGYPFESELVAIEYYCPECGSHDYKRIEEKDRQLYEKACIEFDKIKDSLPIPNQAIPEGYNTNQVRRHGYHLFSDLFNKRQLLCLGKLLKSINEYEDDETKFWLLLAFSGMLEMNNMFCRYQANAYKICNIFFNHAYVPISMPVENNVWGSKLGTGNFVKTINKIIKGKEFCSSIYDIRAYEKDGKIVADKEFSDEVVKVHTTNDISKIDVNHPVLLCQDSSTLDILKDKSVDIVLTDPPFGANVMYSELIDFFHVWLYNSALAKDLGFETECSPKEEEIIVNPIHNKTQKDYEEGLSRVFSECNRVLTDNGMLIFSFHDKSLESWKSVLNSISNAGFDLVKTYPLHAETRTGAHTSNKNSIALDIMLICQKSEHVNHPNTYNRMDIEQTAYSKLDSIVERLMSVDAEITIPDIENIFISEYICACNLAGIHLTDAMENEYDNLKDCLNTIYDYCEKYDITSKRSGWWSEAFKEKWNI